jgi:hypothetical protein
MPLWGVEIQQPFPLALRLKDALQGDSRIVTGKKRRKVRHDPITSLVPECQVKLMITESSSFPIKLQHGLLVQFSKSLIERVARTKSRVLEGHFV